MWFLVSMEGERAGVLLLNYLKAQTAFNLTFMGVTPEMRGRGLGETIVRFSLATIARSRPAPLTLAVDLRNWPARKIYDRLGFVETSRKTVLVKILAGESSGEKS